MLKLASAHPSVRTKDNVLASLQPRISCLLSLGACTALEGLPVVNEEKFDKLKTLLLNRFRAHGEIKDGNFFYFYFYDA